VAQAQIFGGASRERQVLVDPLKLLGAGLTLEDLYGAARRATELIGGGYIETPTQRIVLQAQAAGATPAALAQAVIAVRNGAALRIGDVATVRDAAEPSFGDAMIGGGRGFWLRPPLNTAPIPWRYTSASSSASTHSCRRLRRQGVQYHPALLRPASFIESAIEKLRNSLLTGAVLVVPAAAGDAA
jgi:Cu/Ag efflux pump CusA